MKYKLVSFLGVLLILSLESVMAQTANPLQGCGFLNGLKFKNGADTIWVLGFKDASVRTPPHDTNLDKLSKEKRLSKQAYNYCVSIIPLDCSDKFVAFCSDTSSFAFKINGYNYKKKVLLKCIVYEG